MTATKFEEWLAGVIDEATMGDDDAGIARVESFDEAGVLTRNRGLVVAFVNGSEIQLTLVQSRCARNDRGHDRMVDEPEEGESGENTAPCERCGAETDIDDFDARRLDGVCSACLRDEDDGIFASAARVNGVR